MLVGNRRCPGCRKKSTDTTRWGGHKGGWDRQSGLCTSCFEQAFQGSLFDDAPTHHLDGSLEAPGIGLLVEGGRIDDLGPNQVIAPVDEYCPECGRVMAYFRPMKTGKEWEVGCEKKHKWKSKLEVFEIMEGWE